MQSVQLCKCGIVQDCAKEDCCGSAIVSPTHRLTLRSRVAADLDILPIASGRCLEPCCGVSTRPLFDQLVHFLDGWQPGWIYCSALVRIDTSHFFRLLSSHWPRSNTFGFGTKQNCCRLLSVISWKIWRNLHLLSIISAPLHI